MHKTMQEMQHRKRRCLVKAMFLSAWLILGLSWHGSTQNSPNQGEYIERPRGRDHNYETIIDVALNVRQNARNVKRWKNILSM